MIKIKAFVKLHKYNIIGYCFFLVAFIFLFGDRILNNFKNEGTVIESQPFINLEGQTTSFPINNEKSVAIFWASWCTPCKVEMDRFQRSIIEGKILPGKIVAINPFETKKEILDFQNKHKYKFTFLIQDEHSLAKRLKISATPTVVFFDGLKVKKISSGISLVGIVSAEFFLK